jgi:hypothetical protein
MSPPGKKRGVTTWESVVRARRSAPSGTTALSWRSARAGRRERLQEDALDELTHEASASSMRELAGGVLQRYGTAQGEAGAHGPINLR